MRGLRFYMQDEPLWLLAMRVLNKKYFKKKYLDFIKNEQTKHFIIHELCELGYIRRRSKVMKSVPTRSSRSRLNFTFETIKDFDLNIFFHFWKIEMLTIIDKRKEIVRRNQRLNYLKKFKKFRSGEIDHLSIKST